MEYISSRTHCCLSAPLFLEGMKSSQVTEVVSVVCLLLERNSRVDPFVGATEMWSALKRCPWIQIESSNYYSEYSIFYITQSCFTWLWEPIKHASVKKPASSGWNSAIWMHEQKIVNVKRNYHFTCMWLIIVSVLLHSRTGMSGAVGNKNHPPLHSRPAAAELACQVQSASFVWVRWILWQESARTCMYHETWKHGGQTNYNNNKTFVVGSHEITVNAIGIVCETRHHTAKSE